MRSRLLLFVVLAGTALPVAAAPDEPLSFEEKAKLSIRLHVLDLESRQLFKDYEAARQLEREMQQALRDYARVRDAAAPATVTQRAKEAQESAEKIRQQLVELEAERLKLLDRLGKKDTAEPAARADPTLEKILEVLMKMDKRLENLERRPPARR